ncbi:MAG: phosphotriesterase [Candidatus Abyssobacteria bacterium SURF_17]|uniref:Phosphotriesterase n=1 Tax=Candidatus Abyssobacteria bacterium SURF_17 TaxID=2093361 RepID=A0A419EZ02_9BACT|nr:MAG: phosphotriesterase [Candidatus Abyssubacteria bacterium SURF_17]
MSEITTVAGPIAPHELGFTSMHEHIVCDMSIFRRRYEDLLPGNLPVSPDEPIRLDNLAFLKHNFILSHDVMDLRNEDVMTGEVADFKASGGSAMVDMSTPGLRCNLPAIQRISEKTGVHIIATTGLYAEDSWPERYRNMSVQEYVGFMLGEIEHGIENTEIKPGHIKVAITDSMMFTVEPFSEQQKRLLRAAARVSNETGLSLSVHPPLDSMDGVREVVALLLEEEIHPERVVFAHAELFFVPQDLSTLVLEPDSWRLNIDHAKGLLDEGFNISIDSFGHFYDSEPIGQVNTTDWQRLAGLVALINAGYSSQIVLGTDMFLKILMRRFGGEGYCRLIDFVVPWLRRLDIAESDISRLTIENPARLLAH